MTKVRLGVHLAELEARSVAESGLIDAFQLQLGEDTGLRAPEFGSPHFYTNPTTGVPISWVSHTSFPCALGCAKRQLDYPIAQYLSLLCNLVGSTGGCGVVAHIVKSSRDVERLLKLCSRIDFGECTLYIENAPGTPPELMAYYINPLRARFPVNFCLDTAHAYCHLQDYKGTARQMYDEFFAVQPSLIHLNSANHRTRRDAHAFFKVTTCQATNQSAVSSDDWLYVAKRALSEAATCIVESHSSAESLDEVQFLRSLI